MKMNVKRKKVEILYFYFLVKFFSSYIIVIFFLSIEITKSRIFAENYLKNKCFFLSFSRIEVLCWWASQTRFNFSRTFRNSTTIKTVM